MSVKSCIFCGREYEAGIGYEFLQKPCCEGCKPIWDRQVEKRQAELVIQEVEQDENFELEQLGIRPRHYDSTFENFNPRDEYEAQTLEICKKMAQERRDILVLMGNNGTGKTHLDSAMAKVGAGKIYKMLEVSMFIRKAFIKNPPYDEEEALQKLSRLKFLIIDEVDKIARSEAELKWLSYIIDERYSRGKGTVLSMNAHPKRIHTDGTTCPLCFETMMTRDILDRLNEVGTVRYFSGESHRLSLRGKA